MESILLKKEDEFYRENEKLEQKAKDLMKKVNDVMKIQDNLIKKSLKTKTEIANAKTGNFKLKERDYQTEYFPAIGDGIDNESSDLPKSPTARNVQKRVALCYKETIRCLQTDNLMLQNENKRGLEEVKKLQKENQSILEEKEKWFNQYAGAKDTIGKLVSQITALNSKYQSRDSETCVIRKELEQIKKELKSSNLKAANLDVRLNRAYEENEKLKESLKNSKDNEKELKESYRKQISNLTATVKRIEKHKRELLDGFKTQSQLIDNLKKQKMYLEVHKIAAMSETEYTSLLNSKFAE